MSSAVPAERDLTEAGLHKMFLLHTINRAIAMRTVSLMTANQEFSRLIKDVEAGEAFLITRRGRPVAKLVPHMVDKTADPEWLCAYGRMMARLETGAPLGGLKVDRDELYDR